MYQSLGGQVLDLNLPSKAHYFAITLLKQKKNLSFDSARKKPFLLKSNINLFSIVTKRIKKIIGFFLFLLHECNGMDVGDYR